MAEILADHWKTYGRNYYSRHDFEAVPTDAANALMSALEVRLDGLAGTGHAGLTVEKADSFSYHDPVDGSVSHNQGLRLTFEGGARAVLRLSGTGTEGATLRVYLEQYVEASGDHGMPVETALEKVRAAVLEITGMARHIGRTDPDVTT